MKLNNYELKKLSRLLKNYLELTFHSTVATKIPHRIFAMELLEKMGREERKCPECKGAGFFALSKERILADPRHTHIKCPMCNGTGKVKGKHEEAGRAKKKERRKVSCYTINTM